MNMIDRNQYARPASFGHRKVMPRACIADSKKHLRTFLAEALEDLYAPQPPRAGVNGHPVAGSTTGDGLGKR